MILGGEVIGASKDTSFNGAETLSPSLPLVLLSKFSAVLSACSPEATNSSMRLGSVSLKCFAKAGKHNMLCWFRMP
jgi:hypothetical protein